MYTRQGFGYLCFQSHADLFVYSRDIIQICSSGKFLSFNIRWPSSHVSCACLIPGSSCGNHKEERTTIVFKDQICAIFLCPIFKKKKKKVICNLQTMMRIISLCNRNNSYNLSQENYRWENQAGKWQGEEELLIFFSSAAAATLDYVQFPALLTSSS